jgi:hypothetical protein
VNARAAWLLLEGQGILSGASDDERCERAVERNEDRLFHSGPPVDAIGRQGEARRRTAA